MNGKKNLILRYTMSLAKKAPRPLAPANYCTIKKLAYIPVPIVAPSFLAPRPNSIQAPAGQAFMMLPIVMPSNFMKIVLMA